jgi:hypothetical protein
MMVGFFVKLTLTRLEARIGLADHVHTALAANDLAVRVTMFERLKRGCYFHGLKDGNESIRPLPVNARNRKSPFLWHFLYK